MSRSKELAEVRHSIFRNEQWERKTDYAYVEYDPRKFLQLFLLSTNYQGHGMLFQTMDLLCHDRQILFHTPSIKLLFFYSNSLTRCSLYSEFISLKQQNASQV